MSYALLMLSEYDWDRCSYVVCLPWEGRRKQLEDRFNAFEDLKTTRKDLAEILYWDLLEVYEVCTDDPVVEEVLEELRDCRVMFVPEKPVWCTELVRWDTCKMHITDESVCWSARLKHEDHLRYTDTIYRYSKVFYALSTEQGRPPKDDSNEDR